MCAASETQDGASSTPPPPPRFPQPLSMQVEKTRRALSALHQGARARLEDDAGLTSLPPTAEGKFFIAVSRGFIVFEAPGWTFQAFT